MHEWADVSSKFNFALSVFANWSSFAYVVVPFPLSAQSAKNCTKQSPTCPRWSQSQRRSGNTCPLDAQCAHSRKFWASCSAKRAISSVHMFPHGTMNLWFFSNLNVCNFLVFDGPYWKSWERIKLVDFCILNFWNLDILWSRYNSEMYLNSSWW